METSKYILVTGSSSGIGAQVAKDLSAKYPIILNGRDKDRLSEVRECCQGDNHLIWQYDLSNIEDIERNLKLFFAEKGIQVSGYVHCAGYMKTLPLKAMNASTYTMSMNTNVISAALISKTLVNKKVNGDALKGIVLISSNISNFGAKAFSAYSASKAGLDGLMRSLAMELAPKVRVNSVLPGGVRTRMTGHMYEDAELITRMEATYPLGLGDVTDISNAVEFLLCDKARWITGQQLTVDGGRTVNITG